MRCIWPTSCLCFNIETRCFQPFSYQQSAQQLPARLSPLLGPGGWSRLSARSGCSCVGAVRSTSSRCHCMGGFAPLQDVLSSRWGGVCVTKCAEITFFLRLNAIARAIASVVEAVPRTGTHCGGIICFCSGSGLQTLNPGNLSHCDRLPRRVGVSAGSQGKPCCLVGLGATAGGWQGEQSRSRDSSRDRYITGRSWQHRPRQAGI